MLATSRIKRTFAASLTKKQLPKEKYMNRIEWMGHRMKNEYHDTYDWVPEVMTSIDPAPAYVYPAIPKGGITERKRRTAQDATDMFRVQSLNRRLK